MRFPVENCSSKVMVSQGRGLQKKPRAAAFRNVGLPTPRYCK